ncbi:hypothetical protein [Flavobacterium sp. XGLA_31]|uniref:hypothetical protein n=1 Tax=Flavobacterium sp. XGLA_31 TaxID=3447666 RepID=UPI003F3EB31C
MQSLKNTAIGFLVSFVGSVPLGYLNVVGFQVFEKSGGTPTVLYLLGVVCIECFVIYGTLLFARQLTTNSKLTRFIEVFSILFMFVLAFVFYFGSNSKTGHSITFHLAPFILGIVLNCLNFMQLPFWAGWNLYLLNENHIEVSGGRKYFYIVGTLVGTFFGMLVLIVALHYFAGSVDLCSRYLMPLIIPLVFLGFGIIQTGKLYLKYKN